MTNSENNFYAMSENARLEREAINIIVNYFLPSLYGKNGKLESGYEDHAITAVAAHLLADGDMFTLAKYISRGDFICTEEEVQVLSRAYNKLLMNKNFIPQLFDGDATELILTAIRDSKKELRL